MKSLDKDSLAMSNIIIDDIRIDEDETTFNDIVNVLNLNKK
jgi:hypothetical protein